jgi:hypothetical protein
MTRFTVAASPLAFALTLGASAAGAQSLAQRVAAAGPGEVRMTYATRAGVCGDGGKTVAVGDVFTMYPSMESYGHWTSTRCKPGVARVSLQKGANGVESVRTRVGGSWDTSTDRVVDLGTVSAPQAATFFLDLAGTLDGNLARNTLLAAAIADSIDINSRLLALAQRSSSPTETRRRAVSWLGEFADGSFAKPLAELAKTDSDDKKSIADAAVAALSRLPDGAGTPALIEIAHTSPSDRLRGKAVFWLGQSDDPRGRREVRAIAADAGAPDEVRARAAFSVGESDAATADDYRFLRDLFGRVNSEKIRDQILMVMSHSDDSASRGWLLSVARDENAPVEARKKAIFWAGQGDIPTSEIASVYDAVTNRAVKEHTIFVLSQRDDQAATDKLMSIATGNGDTSLRKKALFWLGQKDDPAVTKAISDLVTRP